MIKVGDTISLRYKITKRKRSIRSFQVVSVIRPQDDDGILILRPLSGKSGRKFSLTEQDCSYYGISYEEGLEVWHARMEWYNDSEMQRQEQVFRENCIGDNIIALNICMKQLTSSLVMAIDRKHKVDEYNAELKKKIRKKIHDDLQKKNEDIAESKRMNNKAAMMVVSNCMALMGDSMFDVLEKRQIDALVASLEKDCIRSAGVVMSRLAMPDKSEFFGKESVLFDTYQFKIKVYNLWIRYIAYCSAIHKAYNSLFHVDYIKPTKETVKIRYGLELKFSNTEDEKIFKRLTGKGEKFRFCFYTKDIMNNAREMLSSMFHDTGIQCRITTFVL